jgi:methylated-DNA-protein-cysteine methyltransferase-like protein
MTFMKQGNHYSEFSKAIYRVVAAIPAEMVATYGQIALMLGKPGAARSVGNAMARAPEGLPCHRVVNSLGGLCSGNTFGGQAAQRGLLESEGITFLPNGRVDLKKHIFRGAHI